MLSFVRCDVLMTLLSFGALGLALSGKRTEYAVKETHHVPRQWSRIQTAPKDHLIRLQIALKQSQFSELERHLYEVSDPSHVRYGQHLSQEDVHDLVKPSSEALSQVHEWLESCNVTQSQLEYTPAKDWIKVTLPVETIERLLDTEYSVFQHRDDGTHLVRTTQWSLPMYLHEHVDAIQPTNSFFRPSAKRSQVMRVEDIGDLAGGTTPSDGTLAKVCNVTAVTPDCLRTLYGTIDYTPAALGKNQIALTNYLGEVNNRSDVSIFLQKFRPEAVSAAQNFTTIVIDDGDNDQGLENSTELSAGKDLEGNLDAETIIGITYPTKLTTYNVGGSPPFIPDSLTPTDTNEPYLTWLQYMLNQTNDQIPQVISTSYGDNEQTIPLSYATAVCNSFAQLGARGVTVLFASGDNGVGPADDCFTNDGKNTSTFLPAFPAGCPYVTTVGGTKNVAPEIVAFDDANGFVSGGGFSNYFARPYYQDSVVPAYVTNLGDQFSGLYNGSGRGYPDIAAQGFRFLTIWNGTTAGLDGTSAATPTAASIISLVNDALLAAGKPVLGFMNPWLYSTGYKAFTDVTDGSAIGCNTTGFPAATGWDAVTGFGTPYFPRVQAVALGNGMCHDFVPAALQAVLAAIFVSGFVTLI